MSVKPEPSESTPPSSPEPMDIKPGVKPVKPDPPPPERTRPKIPKGVNVNRTPRVIVRAAESFKRKMQRRRSYSTTEKPVKPDPPRPESSPRAVESTPVWVGAKPSESIPPRRSEAKSEEKKVELCKYYQDVDTTPREIIRAAQSVRRMMQLRRSYSTTEAASVRLEEQFVDEVSKTVEDSLLSLQSIDELPTIYRAPEYGYLRFKEIAMIAYKPEVMCIGPFTSGVYSSFPLQDHPLQDHKWCCVNKLIARHRNLVPSNPSRDFIDRCLREMKALEPRVRSCYSETIQSRFSRTFDSDDLALMMMLDGCFILYLLLNQDENIHEALKDLEDSPVVFGKLWIWPRVKYDLLLLENQIPFFVVEKLFDLLKTTADEHVNLVKLALKLFSNLQFHRAETLLTPMPSVQIHHLLHLFYISIVPNQVSVGQLSLPSPTPDWISCAAELREAGIKFKKKKNARNLFDIKFSNGIMEIPALEIHDSSYRLFRNLIAFEQCYPDTQCRITAYAQFMDCLINTPLDMRLLHLDGILTDRTGINENSTYFFKHLCYRMYIASDKNYLGNVYAEVAKFQGTKWHKWRAGLARDYFNNPWTVISVVAAAVLLLLTTIQTFFTVYPYFKPNN